MRTAQYLVNCDYAHSERDADYSLRETAELFEFSPEHEGGHGNLCSDLIIDAKSLRAKFVKKSFPQPEGKESFHRVIPSALLMYRLSCLFEGNATFYGPKGYKFVWQFPLKHKETGESICFGEWKGASLFWTNHGIESAPKAFKRDVERLISALVSKRCPHPYDGLVAGGVA